MTGISDIPVSVDAFFDEMLLRRARPNLVHAVGAQMKTLPQNAGAQTIRFRRYTKLAQNVATLTEGTTPAGKTLASTLVTATLAQYGDFVKVFDRLAGTTKEGIFAETADLLADQAGESLDSVTRDVIYAGTAVEFAGAGSARGTVAAGEVILIVDIRDAVQVLHDNDASQFTEMAAGTDQVGTVPIRKAYWGLIHTSQRQTLKQLTGFVEAHNYPSTVTPFPMEIGEIEGIRFLETTNGAVFAGAGAGGIDVYGTLIYGQGFHAVVEPGTPAPQAGEPKSPLGLQFIAHTFGESGESDPLNQRSSGGWKADFAAVILNNAFGIRIEAALV